MKFDPHLIKIIFIVGALALRFLGRSTRKKARSAPKPTPQQAAPQPSAPQPLAPQTSAPQTRPKSQDDSPWTSGGNPFDS